MNPLIIYHANCHDGFGGAFAAWKKFGAKAEYYPARHGEAPPEVTGRDVFIIDFSYPAEILKKIESAANSLMVLDHHAGSEADVKSISHYVYDNDHSGATLAWTYFHPNVPTPKLLLYLEQDDLHRFDLARTRDIATYLRTTPFSFEVYEKLLKDFEDEGVLALFAEKGAAFSEYRQVILNTLAETAEEVELSGFRVLAVNAPHQFRDDLASKLATRRPPFGIVWYPEKEHFRFSLRGDGTVNLYEIAKKYGSGGGHHNAASFRWDLKAVFPFKKIEK